MQTRNTITELVKQLSFNKWRFHLGFNHDVPYLQVKFLAPCNVTGRLELQSCRKWMLSYYMCDEEIVSTGLKAVLAAVEHEAREQFKWRGQPIYRPHYSLDALYEISKHDKVDKRKEMQS